MPAPTTETILFDVHDFRVWPMISDSSSAASPTYGTGVDVPGIAEVSLDRNMVTAELKGDGRTMAKRGKIDKMNLSATYGKLSADVLEVLESATITDATTSSRVRLSGNNSLPYFLAAFVINDVETGLGQVRCILWKSQLTGGALLSQSTDSFGQPELEVESIPCESNPNLFRDIDFLTTAQNLSSVTPAGLLSLT